MTTQLAMMTGTDDRNVSPAGSHTRCATRYASHAPVPRSASGAEATDVVTGTVSL